MGKMTFVVEYEDGKEPKINFSTEILGGRLTAAAFYDYHDDLLTQDEANAVNSVINFGELEEACQEFEVNYDEVVAKLESII